MQLLRVKRKYGRVEWVGGLIGFACNCDRCVCPNYRMIIDRGLDTMDVDVRKIENNSEATARTRVFNYNWKNYKYRSSSLVV